jgi:hypothetical protein
MRLVTEVLIMLELVNMPLIEILGLAGLAPVVVLAALAVVDLRALMLVRAVTLMKRRARPGETVISGDEWIAQGSV